jgi:exosortase H (IPTLxxWG-CTERM-specific)
MRRFALLFAVILLALFTLELTPPGQAVVRPWTAFVAETSSAFIRAFDGDARAQGNMVYSARSGFAMTIEAGCNGIEAMLVLLAGILAYPRRGARSSSASRSGRWPSRCSTWRAS